MIDDTALRTDPYRFHGQRITATGLFTCQFENRTFAGAWLHVPGNARHPRGEFRVRVVGTWHAEPGKGYGHMSMWKSELRAESLEILEEIIAPTDLSDPQTRLLPRFAFDEQYEASPAQALVMVDVDGLHAYNTARGHDEGTALLRRGAAAFRKSAGEKRLAGRLGGDSFVTTLPIAEARAMVDAFRAALRTEKATWTAAVVETRGERLDDVLARARICRREAKARGGDCVITEADVASPTSRTAQMTIEWARRGALDLDVTEAGLRIEVRRAPSVQLYAINARTLYRFVPPFSREMMLDDVLLLCSTESDVWGIDLVSIIFHTLTRGGTLDALARILVDRAGPAQVAFALARIAR